MCQTSIKRLLVPTDDPTLLYHSLTGQVKSEVADVGWDGDSLSSLNVWNRTHSNLSNVILIIPKG